MSKDNGGPAFPVSDVMALEPRTTAEMVSLAHGMSLRDYMATHASKEDVDQVMLENYDFDTERYLITRQQARYLHADFMLAERAK